MLVTFWALKINCKTFKYLEIESTQQCVISVIMKEVDLTL